MKSRLITFAIVLAFMAMGVAVAQTDQKKSDAAVPTTKATPTAAAKKQTEQSKTTSTSATSTKPMTKKGMTASSHNMTAMAGGMNIIQRASKAGNFSIFLDLCKQADMTKILEGKGPYTVFAPTDEAFKKMSPEQLAALKNDKARLTDFLKHHIVEGKQETSMGMMKMQSDKMMPMSGSELMYRNDNGTMMVGDAKLLSHEMMASNGVIHAIDNVLMSDAPPVQAAAGK